MALVDPARLKSQLLNTGLQVKDNPLYQVIWSILDVLSTLNDEVNAIGPPGSGTTIIQQTIQQLMSGDSDGSGGGEMGPPGVTGEDGANGMVPYFIASTEIFTVPIYKQALFAMNIDNEGMLVVDGFLIEVDGASDPDCCNRAFPVIYPDSYVSDENGYPPGNVKNPISIDISTTGNIDDLDFGNADLIRMTNASLATIRGLKAGWSGQIVGILSKSAQVDLAHQNINSGATYRLINTVTSGVTSLAAGVGYAVYQYDGVTERWKLITHEQGAFIDIPYAAGNFTASGGTGGTWDVAAGDQAEFAYYVQGDLVTVTFTLATWSISTANPQFLNVAFPNGYTTSKLMPQNPTFVGDAGVTVPGSSFITDANSGNIRTYYISGANWGIGVNNGYLYATVRFPIA